MKQFLYKAFNIEQDEGLSVLLLILQSFFLGIFYGSFDVTASALFLESFPASMLPKAFVISGIVGIILTGIYTKLQSHISFSKLAWINLFSITFIILLLRIGFYYTDVKWLPFFILVMLGPLTIISMLGFWGMAGRVFTLRQGKRLFGLIDSGQVFGVIVSSYTIPLILVLNFSTHNLLYVSSISVLLALVVQIVLSRKFPVKEKAGNGDAEHKKSMGLGSILRNKFVIYMSLFVALSMISAFFIYYSFLSVTNIKYPDSKELAKFLGVFTGTVMIFTFLFKTFVYSKIMQTYNLRTSLLILPTLLILLSALAVIVGLAFGFSAETQGFILFFLLISLSRLFSRSLKESIEAPSFKILYLSLDKNIRYDIQARIDGVVNEFSALFSGLALAGLGMLSFIKPIHYTYILIIILIIWFLVTIKLYREYQTSLIKSLSGNSRKNEINYLFKNNTSVLSENIMKEPQDTVINKLIIAELTDPILFENILLGLLSHSSPVVQKFALEKIRDKQVFDAVSVINKYIQTSSASENRKLAIQIKEKFNEKLGNSFSKEQITLLVKSKHADEREFAAKIISHLNDSVYYPYLVALLRDIDFNVRTASIKACTHIRYIEVCPLLIEYLADPNYANYAANALITIGEETLNILELSFYKSDLDTAIQSRIIKIFSRIGSEKATALLMDKLNFPVREITKNAIIALNQNKYQFNESHYIYIRPAIDLTISVIAWNLNALFNSKEENINPELNEALQEELKESYDLLYMLLSLLYDPAMIATVKDNIENGSGEGVSYALELFDLYVAEDLKPIIFPLFENTSISEKIKRLQDYFPLEKQESFTLLNSIITRDINLINRWTKACAIFNLQKFNKIKASNDILAHLFNSDKLLFETTGYIVHLIDPESYNICGKRLSVKLRNDLDYQLVLATEKKTHLLYEKVTFLKSIPLFKSINHLIITDMAEMLDEIKIGKEEKVFSKNNKDSTALYFIIKGKVKLVNHENTHFEFEEKAILTEYMLLESFAENAGFFAVENSEFYSIDRKNFMQLVVNHEEILSLLMKASAQIA